MPRSTKLLWASCLRMSNSARKSHWNVAATLAPPTGIVTVHVFTEKDVQPDQLKNVRFCAGVAVSPTICVECEGKMKCTYSVPVGPS
jgi:hypothetical protein